MTKLEIYNQIHSAIVEFWTMFIGSPTDSFTTLLWSLAVYGTQFFLGFLFFYAPWLIFRCFWGD